jgi:hypothetical protein
MYLMGKKWNAIIQKKYVVIPTRNDNSIGKNQNNSEVEDEKKKMMNLSR